MADVKSNVEQVASTIEKKVAEQAARIETGIGELAKLQAKSLAQATAFFEDAARLTREQVAFVEQLGGEWKKLLMASTKNAAELFTHRA